MRHTFRHSIALAVLTVACSSETVPPPPPPPVNWKPLARAAVDAGPPKATDKERAAAAAYAKALSTNDPAPLAAVLDDDAHFAFGGMRDAHGQDKVIAAHQALFGAFDQRVFTPSRIWLTDSAQALEWTLSGVQGHDWMGIAATHKPVVIKGLTLLWTNDDGSVTDVHVNFDTALVKAQLGAGPKELAGIPAPQPATPGGAVELEQGRTDEESANVATVRASLSALEKGDEAAYLATMADDVEVTSLERVQPMRGKEDARAYMKTLRKEIADLDTSVDNAWGVKQFVIVEYFIVGTQQLPIGWIPLQKDRLLKMSVVDVVEMRGGRIGHVWRYDDPEQVLSAP